MGSLITKTDLADLQSLYPYAGFEKGFTRQQEQFILHYVKGQSATAAARAAGYSGSGTALLNDERIQRAIELLREKTLGEIRISRDMLNGMLLEAHAKSATATEEINAIRELGKMNGLYEADKQKASPVQINIGSQVSNVKQIERLSDKELLELAGDDIALSSDEYEVIDEK